MPQNIKLLLTPFVIVARYKRKKHGEVSYRYSDVRLEIIQQ
jgi:uncharacterized protein Veg